MIKSCKIFLCIIMLCLCSHIFTNLTTLQYWDPSPIYSATNFMMPSHGYIANVKKTRMRDNKKTKDRCFGVSFSGLVQGACRATDCGGCNEYGSSCSDSTSANGNQMGDFRGTLYGFGLFLGNSPNGKNIWASGVDNGNIYNITPDSINATQLPSCLKNIIKQLSGNFDISTGKPTSSGNILTSPSQAIMFNPDDETVKDASKDCFGSLPCIPGVSPSPACVTTPSSPSTCECKEATFCGPDASFCNPLAVGPSIFDTQKLKTDTKQFGAYSLPLEYKKYAFRMEVHAEVSDNIGITMQTGIAHIKQTTTGAIDLSKPSNYSPNTCNSDSTTGCPVASSSSSSDGTLYDALRFQGINGNTATCPSTCQVPVICTQAEAQNIFDIFFINMRDEILDKECGINQSLKNFEDYSIEDVRLFLTFKHTHGFNRYFKNEDNEEQSKWPEMLFTIYGWAGGSFPVAEKKDYTKVLSLPFGNNGHTSLGTGIGMTYDFEDTIEMGAEIGATYFLSQAEKRPFPNHELQRGLYPFYADVITEPGLNWHFKAMMNAYHCIPHVSFWASYEFIEHTKDKYKLCFNNTITKKAIANDCSIITPTNSKAYLSCQGQNLTTNTEQRIFIPEVLERCSTWRAQFINLAATVDLGPSAQASLVWQQPISPRNAYYPVSIVGSLSFIF